jgi:hypothetical protein
MTKQKRNDPLLFWPKNRVQEVLSPLYSGFQVGFLVVYTPTEDSSAEGGHHVLTHGSGGITYVVLTQRSKTEQLMVTYRHMLEVGLARWIGSP